MPNYGRVSQRNRHESRISTATYVTKSVRSESTRNDVDMKAIYQDVTTTAPQIMIGARKESKEDSFSLDLSDFLSNGTYTKNGLRIIIMTAVDIPAKSKEIIWATNPGICERAGNAINNRN